MKFCTKKCNLELQENLEFMCSLNLFDILVFSCCFNSSWWSLLFQPSDF